MNISNETNKDRKKNSRNPYKSRNHGKLSDKVSNSQKYQSVCINPEILRRLGYIRKNPNVNETVATPIELNKTPIIQNSDPCCLNPIDLLHPNDPNRVQYSLNQEFSSSLSSSLKESNSECFPYSMINDSHNSI